MPSRPETPSGPRPLQTGPLQTGPLQTGPLQAGPLQTGLLRPGPFHLAFHGDALSVRGALHTLAGAPPLRDLTEQGRATAELVLAEVLNNIVEHAFALGPGPIEVRFDPCAGGIACHITDRGRAMPADRAPDGHFPAGLDGPPSTLPEGGFGWFLIRSLTHDLRYDRTGGLNHLRFTLPIC